MTGPTTSSVPVPEPEPFGSALRPANEPSEKVDPRVGSALARLESLGQLPPADQLAELEEVHRLLQDTLATLDGV